MSTLVHGAGCALMDYLYRGVDFSSPAITRIVRRAPGDGGLTIGGLVFAEALERFAGTSIDEIIADATGGADPDSRNVGGPAIVSLINTAQLVPSASVRFFGAVGTDDAGADLTADVARTPLDIAHLRTMPGATAATYVLSDPAYDGGHGERSFVNVLGVAADYGPAELGDEFVRADIVQLGGTALVPCLHASLPGTLAAARAAGALTVVNTVYDFRAETSAPGKRWLLGSDDAYPNVDLLITDAEEASRLTGTSAPDAAVAWFLDRGAGAVVVTDGPRPVRAAARGARWAPLKSTTVAVLAEYSRSADVRTALGDTTGCGDNFAGGLVAGIAMQVDAGEPRVDLRPALSLAVASGAFCLTHLGGTYLERVRGEKLRLVQSVADRYETKKEVDSALPDR